MPENDSPKLILDASTQIDPNFWLNAANAAVRRECGWHVAPILEETLTLDGRGGRALLIPSKRVVELIQVLNAGVDVTADVDHSKAGILELHRGAWTTRLGRVSVRLRHGYDPAEVPDVAALVASLARRGASSRGPIASQSIGNASVSYMSNGGAPLSIPLMGVEKDTLAPFRLEWGY